jgi:acetyl esterase/lipase
MKIPRGLVSVPLLLSCLSSGLAAEPAPIPLWPGVAPDEPKPLPPEADMTKPTDPLIAGRRIIKLGNVSTPTITIYRPDPAKDTGATVVVCPGGGYHILALDLEGTEVCTWLNSIGVTGVLLKYRVPARPGQERYAAALQDAQRAVGLVRHRAGELGLDPRRIGILGFSAGASLSAVLAGHYSTRNYPAVDAADAVSCRPDFMVLVYPGGFVEARQGDALRREYSVRKDETPPAFIAMAEDDPVGVENAVQYYLALKKAGVPAEMHLYPTGGHGYGLRRSEHDVTTWPDRAADWLQTGGWLKRSP